MALPTYSTATSESDRPVSPAEQLGMPADDGDYTWLSYTEKMAMGVFGRIPGAEALRRSMVPTPSPTGAYIYEFYGCFGQGFCNTTCTAYPTTNVDKGEALCSQIQASYQRNVMVFDNHTECLNGANVPLSCGSKGAYPFYHYVRVA
ncbi:hypothetical protein QFC20_002555 [Naganishia adeliensis]|uniref:Uncharacterized protein n=1 Tax=Naganishia adeliensis TaxID=92952 RepID=A0ACC2WIJ8_9TREE|nr:hypothetical protein QFC20_002555 [Naganishia adeliensis]